MPKVRSKVGVQMLAFGDGGEREKTAPQSDSLPPQLWVVPNRPPAIDACAGHLNRVPQGITEGFAPIVNPVFAAIRPQDAEFHSEISAFEGGEAKRAVDSFAVL